MASIGTLVIKAATETYLLLGLAEASAFRG